MVKTLPSSADSVDLTLVRELRSYMTQGPKTKTLKEKKKRSNKKTKQESVFNKKTFKNKKNFF